MEKEKIREIVKKSLEEVWYNTRSMNPVEQQTEILTENLYNELSHNKNDQPLNINLHEFGYSCGDGCCYNYGTVVTVNNIELDSNDQEAGTMLKNVLDHLGYNVNITYSEDYD
jgi:hypothetical protein